MKPLVFRWRFEIFWRRIVSILEMTFFTGITTPPPLKTILHRALFFFFFSFPFFFFFASLMMLLDNCCNTSNIKNCQNFLIHLWSSQNTLSWSVNCKTNSVDQGCYCYLNSSGFTPVKAICNDYSCGGVFQSASETIPLIGSAVVLGTSGEFMPVRAATQCFLLNACYSVRPIIYSKLNIFHTPFERVFHC